MDGWTPEHGYAMSSPGEPRARVSLNRGIVLSMQQKIKGADQQIFAFVFAYAKGRSIHDMAQI